MKHQTIKIFLLIVALTLSGASWSYAARISRDEAAGIAVNTLSASNISKAAPGGGVLGRSEVIDVASSDSYYVFSTRDADRGFVIVSADDRLEPVVGYSLNTKFDPDNMPAAMKAYLSDYSRVAAAIRSGAVEYSKTTRGGAVVEPLLTVKWNQAEPYDRLTPMYGDRHAPTGCVATAIAQIMRHFRFPEAGRGVAGYPGGQSVTLGHSYDWDNMLDRYVTDGTGSPVYTDAQADAVALLMRDVGYAVYMDYGYDVSGASSAAVAAVMARNFNYSTDIRYCDRGSYTTQGWTDEIRANLLSGSPVLYGGSDGSNGHEFVCDGIDANDFLHINWGWGGYGDGYFDMNILSPEYLGTGAGNGAYYRDQDIVAGIRPGDAGIDNTSWLAPMSLGNIVVASNIDIDGKIVPYEYSDYVDLVVNFRIYNTTGDRIEYSQYSTALMIEDADGGLTGIYNPYRLGALEVGYYYERSVAFDCSTLRDGSYVASVVVIPTDKAGDELSREDLFAVSAGDLNRIGITVRNGEVYLDDPSISNNKPSGSLKMLGCGEAGTIYAESGADFVFTILNELSICVDETLSLYLVPVDEDRADIDLNTYESYGYGTLFLYPRVQSEVTVSCYTTPAVPGKYRVYLRRSGNYEIIRSETPVYVDIVGLPDNQISMVGKLRLSKPAYPRNNYIRFGADFNCYNPFVSIKTNLSLWARRKDAPADEEIMLIAADRTLYQGNNGCSLDDWTESNDMWYMPLGEYEAYIKYVDSEGRLIRLDCENNSAFFTLVESDEDVQAVLASPMVVNGGKPVFAIDWTTFDVEFEMMTPTGMNINVENCYADIYRSPRGDDWLYSFITNSVTFDKVTLQPGESTKVRISYLYRAVEDEPDLIGGTFYLNSLMVSTSESFCKIHPGEYENSMNFRLVDSSGSGISDVETCDGSRIVEYYRLDGSKVAAPTSPGIYIGRRADGTSVKILIR